MKWIIKIKNNKFKKIVIKYEPLNDIVIFNGECKINGNWVGFVSNFITSENIDLKKIQELLSKTYNELVKRYDTYDDLNKGLEVISEVDFGDTDNEDDNENIFKSNDVYGNLET